MKKILGVTTCNYRINTSLVNSITINLCKNKKIEI